MKPTQQQFFDLAQILHDGVKQPDSYFKQKLYDFMRDFGFVVIAADSNLEPRQSETILNFVGEAIANREKEISFQLPIFYDGTEIRITIQTVK